MNEVWHGRPCLVTGGAGFGGSHLCAELLRRGARVCVLDRQLPRDSYLVYEGLDTRVQFIQGDTRDLELLRLTIERSQIDTIFHLAAQPLVALSHSLPLETLNINVVGAYTVLEAMRTTKSARAFVFASSGAHYGATSSDEPIREDDAPRSPTNIYGPSKTAAEVVVRAYASTYALNAVCCRFMNTYGPGDTNFSRIVPRAIRNLLLGDPYDFGDRDDGSTRLDFVNIRDMTDAYLRAAECAADVRGEAINFASGHVISTAELVRLISRIFDGRERQPLFHGATRKTPIVKRLDIQKAERLLGWRPGVDLEDGLAETIGWYRRFFREDAT